MEESCFVGLPRFTFSMRSTVEYLRPQFPHLRRLLTPSQHALVFVTVLSLLWQSGHLMSKKPLHIVVLLVAML